MTGSDEGHLQTRGRGTPRTDRHNVNTFEHRAWKPDPTEPGRERLYVGDRPSGITRSAEIGDPSSNARLGHGATLIVVSLAIVFVVGVLAYVALDLIAGPF